MQNFDYDYIENSCFRVISEFLKNPDYSTEALANKSAVIAGFYGWL
jgi:hypothetical protein